MTVGIGVYKSLFYASRGTLRRSCTFSIVTHCGVLTARFRTVSACVVSLVRDDRRRREGALGTGARFMRPISGSSRVYRYLPVCYDFATIFMRRLRAFCVLSDAANWAEVCCPIARCLCRAASVR